MVNSPEENAPGKPLLLVSGILIIILGGIAFTMALIQLIGILTSQYAPALKAYKGLEAVVAFYPLVVSAAYVMAGVIGVKNAGKPYKGHICYKIGIVMVVLAGLGLFLGVIGGSFSFADLLGCMLYGVYLYGAHKNVQEAQLPRI